LNGEVISMSFRRFIFWKFRLLLRVHITIIEHSYSISKVTSYFKVHTSDFTYTNYNECIQKIYKP